MELDWCPRTFREKRVNGGGKERGVCSGVWVGPPAGVPGGACEVGGLPSPTRPKLLDSSSTQMPAGLCHSQSWGGGRTEPPHHAVTPQLPELWYCGEPDWAHEVRGLHSTLPSYPQLWPCQSLAGSCMLPLSRALGGEREPPFLAGLVQLSPVPQPG